MLTDENMEILSGGVPFMGKLTPAQRQLVKDNARYEENASGSIYRTGVDECKGLVLVVKGQFRAFYASEDGKEITLYRLLSGDVCVMTMSCVLKNITFDVNLEAELPSALITIPVNVFNILSRDNASVKDYELEHVSARFSDVFWVMEQVVFRGMGQRVAAFLLDQAAYQGSNIVRITHEMAAKDLGTAREVISRMLKYFEGEGLVRQSRGSVELIDLKGLKKMSA